MPKELAHWMLAEKSLERLDRGGPLYGLIMAHRDLYLAGAVLPDTLLHLFYGPWSKQALTLADRFHDTAGNSFMPLIEAEATFPAGMPGPLMACLLGIICHMQADVVLHPFVYAHSGVADIGRHYRIETDIDCHVMQRCRAYSGRRLAELVQPANRGHLITALSLVFDPCATLPAAALEQSLSLHCRLQSMYDSTFWKLAALGLALLPVRFFRKNSQLFYPLRHGAAPGSPFSGQWRHPVTGERVNTSLDELLEEAVGSTVAVLQRIEQRGSLADALRDPPGGNLLTGIHGIQLSAAVHAAP